MRFHILAATTALALAGFAAQSEASVLSARVYEDNVLQSLGGTSSAGALTLQGSTTNFSQVLVNGFGTPFTPEPSLIGQTTQISSDSNFTGTHTLRIELTQTDLSSATAGGAFAQFVTTFTANLLVKGSTISSVTISTFADASNAAYGTATQLASSTFTSGSPVAAGPFQSNVALNNALFSETLVISATFTEGGAALQASSQITAGPVAVPEPASIALFSTGLVAMGMLVSRRRRD
jgi:hypothetical protein